VRSSAIGTYSGGRFYPLDPRPEDVVPEDVAHALSLLCRFTGHVKTFYSVGEHCLNVSYLVPPADALAGLLHDAAEAYISDLSSPIKHSPEFRFYREAEDRILAAVYERFGLSPRIPSSVEEADHRIVHTEAAVLFRKCPIWVDRTKVDPASLIYSGVRRPSDIETAYLTRLEELT
jgi:hypothetical protein